MKLFASISRELPNVTVSYWRNTYVSNGTKIIKHLTSASLMSRQRKNLFCGSLTEQNTDSETVPP